MTEEILEKCSDISKHIKKNYNSDTSIIITNSGIRVVEDKEYIPTIHDCKEVILKCPRCGNDYLQGDNYCGYCRFKFDGKGEKP